MNRSTYFMPVFIIFASAIGFFGLVPLAFALPGISVPLFPFGNAIFFLVMLGGPVLLLGSGLRAITARFSALGFLVAFTALVIIVGMLPPLTLQRHGLLKDWIVMALLTSLIAAGLRRGWLWGVVGGAWQSVVLAILAVESVWSAFFSPSASNFSKLTYIWTLGFLLALSSSILAFRRRDSSGLASR
jgi:hypothetical protein